MLEAEAKVWGALTTGIYILTTRGDGKGHGMSASWVVQVSGTPPLLAAAVGQTSYTRTWVSLHRCFGLNVIGRRSRFLQDYFHSAAARRPANLDRVAWDWSPGGVPWLAEAMLCLECEVQEEFVVGDRTVFVSRIAASRWGAPDTPLTSQELPYVYVGEVRPAPRWEAPEEKGAR